MSKSAGDESVESWSERAAQALSAQVLSKPSALVFEGGGVLGTAYPAALRVAEQSGASQDVYQYGGTSVGSLVAGMLACGADIDFLERQIDSTDYRSLFDSTFGIVRDAYRFYNRAGYARGARSLKNVSGI